MEKNVEVKTEKILTKTEAASMLSVSSATLRNWVRLGKISTAEGQGNRFYESDILKLSADIESGKNSALKSRRNKKKADGTAVYKGYTENSENITKIKNALGKMETLSENSLRALLALAAQEIFADRLSLNYEIGKIYSDFLSRKLTFGIYDKLIFDLIGEGNSEKPPVKSLGLKFISDDDTLGFLYLSLSSLKKRKRSGAYFTPSVTVKTALKKTKKYIFGENKKILDPCCGSGNFLIMLSAFTQIENLFGFDTDLISVLLARISIAAVVLPKNISVLYSNIKCENSLKQKIENEFDVILGNPPWGSEMDENEYEFSESAAVFTAFSLSALKNGGFLGFILPDSLNSAAIHKAFREEIEKKSSIKIYVSFKNSFSSVQCPAMLLGLKKEKEKKTECEVYIDEYKYIIRRKNAFNPERFTFNISDSEWKIIEKMDFSSSQRLFNNSDFALGIVTGDNKNLLENEKTEFNEPILRGKDIEKFRVKKAEKFIHFSPEKFQQTAKVDFYRAEEKLIYRFISPVPVFAYDNKKTLTLNSANILIPHIKGMDIKYIMAVLNSSAAQFYFLKKYNSLKVLRSHIENFPIPIAPESEQEKIIKISESIINGADLSEFKEADEKIFSLYSLTSEEIEIVKNILK